MALILAGAVFLLILLWLGARPVYRHASVSEQCCARCRYPVQGLASNTCPECGADLRGEGTLRPGEPLIWYPPRPLAIVCRTLLLAISTALVMSVVASVEDEPSVSAARATATSGSGSFRSLEVRGAGAASLRTQYPDPTPRPGTVAVLTGPNRTVRLRVLDLAMRASYAGPSGRVRTSDAFTDEDILAWMTQAGADPKAPATAQEARAVAALIRNVAVGGGELSLSPGTGAFAGLKAVTISIDWRYRFRPIGLTVLVLVAGLLWLRLIREVRRWPTHRATDNALTPSTPADSAHSAPRSPS
jgi:hypothetical protein